MNRLIWYFLGYDVIEILGASPQWAINELTRRRVPFWNINWKNAFEVTICTFHRHRNRALEAIESSMCEGSCRERIGFFHAFSGLLHRPILIGLLILSLLAVLLLPKFLWFYEVVGSQTVPEAQILRTLEGLHIGLGTYGPDIHPKWIKDHVLQKIPQLEWITVTQNGCKAQVVVRERPAAQKPVDRKAYTNVVASRAGLITELSVLSGQPACRVGDIVMEGELLVSGLVDLEDHYLVSHAEAEIYARTWKKVRLITPSVCFIEQTAGNPRHAVWLELGHHRIKIFGNSGISYASCDKMVNRKILSLPENHLLPVCLVLETYLPQQLQEQPCDMQWKYSNLDHNQRQRLRAHMQAGELLHMDLSVCAEERCSVLEGTAECCEMIARTVEAKWNEEDFKHD